MPENEQKRLRRLIKLMVTHDKTKEDVVRELSNMGFGEEVILEEYETIIQNKQELNRYHTRFLLLPGLALFLYAAWLGYYLWDRGFDLTDHYQSSSFILLIATIWYGVIYTRRGFKR